MRKAVVKTRPGPAASPANAVQLEDLIEHVRTLWLATEALPQPSRERVRSQCVEEVQKLMRTLDSELPLPSQSDQPKPHGLLPFSDEVASAQRSAPKRQPKQPKPDRVVRFPEPVLRVCGKDLAKHALAMLPKAGQCEDFAEYREKLVASLPFNAVATRIRNASYLLNRFFPGNVLFRDLAQFAEAAEGQSALADALFYLTCRTELIVAMVAESIVWPALPDGSVSRSRITDFVKLQFPNSKRATQVASAIAQTYSVYGVAKANRTRLELSVRRGHLATFAYVLHLECPEPGMYPFDKLLDGPMHKWLLWDKSWIVEQLYLLRHAGLLPKVSEIDRLRQFTTRFSLDEAVSRIVRLLKEGQP